MCLFTQHIEMKFIRYLIVRKTVKSPHMFCIFSDIKTIVQLDLISLRFDNGPYPHQTSTVDIRVMGNVVCHSCGTDPYLLTLRRLQGKLFFPKLTFPILITHIQSWLRFVCHSPVLIPGKTWLNACELVSLVL